MKEFAKVAIILFWSSLFLITGWIVLGFNSGWESLQSSDVSERSLVLGRLFGMYAFFFINFQIFAGAWMLPLMRVWRGFFRVHIWTGVATYLLAFAHPGFIYLTVSLQSGFFNPLGVYAFGNGVVFGQIALFVLTVTVLAGLLRKKIGRHWRKIHWANYLIWFIIFFHSRAVGTDTNNSWAGLLFGLYFINLIAGFLFRFLPRTFLPKRTGVPNGAAQ